MAVELVGAGTAGVGGAGIGGGGMLAWDRIAVGIEGVGEGQSGVVVDVVGGDAGAVAERVVGNRDVGAAIADVD